MESNTDDLPELLPLEADGFGDQGATTVAAAARKATLPCEAPHPVPVTLITGFLGAGKTTLVRHILTARHGRRIAVILNEAGSEGYIERAFVRDAGGETAAVPEWVELANGCLCCSVKAEFLQALEALVAPDSAHAGRFDAVLVETTGLADPGPIVEQLWSDEELESAVALDGVVTVVDASNIDRQLSEARLGGAANEAQLQVALADVVLVNKVDLVNSETLVAVEARLKAVNATARVIRCSRGAVDPTELFGCGTYRLRDASGAPLLVDSSSLAAIRGMHGPAGSTLGSEALAAPATAPAEVASGGRGCTAAAGVSCSEPACSEHGHLEGTTRASCSSEITAGAGAAPPQQARCVSHDASIHTVSLQCGTPLRLERFEAWLQGLLWEQRSGGGGSHSLESHTQQQQQQQQQHLGHESNQQVVDGRVLSQHIPPKNSGEADAPSAAAAGPEVLRLKGLLDVAGSQAAHMVQAVYETYDVVPGPPWSRLESDWDREAAAAGPHPGGNAKTSALRPRRGTRLVVIGRWLDEAALQRGLLACVD